MKRTLLSTLVITSTLGLNANVFALGMGELELKSTLNQPLKAEIELTNVEDLTEWEIKPSLASDGDFDRAGVEKLFFLSDIDFEVKGNRIILSSDKSVTEPFLNFLVQVNWPSGRVLREYTLLLDPPLFDETIQPLAPVAVPANAPSKKVESQQAAATQAKSRWQTEAAKPGTYKVQPNDTLWEIAVETRPNRKVTPQQMMLAIQDSNPGAFIAGNINRLKTHQVLRIPNEQQMAARNDGQAISEVLRQNKELQTAGAQLDATSNANKTNKVVSSETGGELKLLAQKKEATAAAAASGDVNNGAADGGRTEKLENELAIALETLDTSKLENEDLKKRLDALEEQIATLQRLVSLKDDQLASIQTMDLQQEAALEEVASPDVDESLDLSSETEASDEALEESITGMSEESDFNYAEGEVEETTAPEVVTSPEVDAALAASQIQQQVEDRYKPKGFVAEVMSKPALMGGIAGGIALLLGLIGFAIKKRRDKGESEVAEPSSTDLVGEQGLSDSDLDESSLDNFEFDEDDHTSNELTDDLLEGIGSDDVEDTSENDETVAQTADIIGEAEIYIAYGRFDQAADLLKNSIQLEPSRIDLRLKLLEVFVETDDSASFAEAELDLNSLGDLEADAKAIAMRKHLSSPAVANEESNNFDALNPDLTESTDLETTSSQDILDMGELADSEDEFASNIDFETALDLPDEGEVLSVEDSESFATSLDALESESDDGSLDFDFSEMDEVSVTGQDLDFDFDLTSENTEEIPTLEESDEIPVLDESDEILTLEGLDELDVPTLDETDELSALNEVDALGEPLENEVPTLDDLGDLDEMGLNEDFSESISNSEQQAIVEEQSFEAPVEGDDFVSLDSLDSADDSDLSELESLLDSEESDEELPSLNFDLEETEIEKNGLDDDLKSLEAELNDLSEPDDEFLDLEETVELDNSIKADESVSLDDTAEDDKLMGDLSELEESLSVDDAIERDSDLVDFETEDSSDTLDAEVDAFEIDGFDSSSDFDLNELDDLPDFSDEEAVGTVEPLKDSSAAQEIDLDQLAAADDEFDFLAGTDECATKLDLARAYMDMEDNEGAKELLQEVVTEGSDQQKHDARALMDSIG